jgi:two-component system, NtrC family, sensor kinase
MKLAPKLTLFLVLIMIIVLAVDAWIRVWRTQALLESDMQTDQRNTGVALGAAMAEVWRVDGRERAFQVLRDANLNAPHVRVRWVRPGAPFGHTEAPELRGAAERLIHGEAFSGVARRGEGHGRLYTYVPMHVDGKPIGALEVSESLAEEYHYIRALVLQRIVITFALTILFAIVAATLGTWLVSRPMQKLVDKARQVGQGDFGNPLALKQHDEVGMLAREIDAMCDQLAQANERIATETNARITALEQLRHADRLATVGQLAAGIAHELGTPLNVVSQRAKMIAQGETEGDETADSARVVVEQSQRIADVIRQLLDFARRRVPKKVPQDLRHIVEQTATFLSPLARKRQIVIHLDCPQDPVTADVDGAQLLQVVTNLAVNGIQAMPQGGELGIAVRLVQAHPPADHGGPAGEYPSVTVSDQGVGIEPENLHRVFEPFFTTKDVGEGTGLGLAVAYGIVREHGGWIAVESEPGRGTIFTIHLQAGPA